MSRFFKQLIFISLGVAILVAGGGLLKQKHRLAAGFCRI